MDKKKKGKKHIQKTSIFFPLHEDSVKLNSLFSNNGSNKYKAKSY